MSQPCSSGRSTLGGLPTGRTPSAISPLARRAIDPLYVIKALFFDFSLWEI
ncbi:hypothetical protein [Microcoleus sp. OTE_8_concoct_300]|uniref:hypothetical protein n=1 Tax=Microcoleus sp. OTE_8_concoct_300 TaxID=2964710 RepID=UPI00403F8340